MTTPNKNNPPRNSQRQRGAAILIMTLILMLGLITLFTFRMDRKAPELEADRKTAMALAQAKEALLGNSMLNGLSSGTSQNPGKLICPDIDYLAVDQGKPPSPPLSGDDCRGATPTSKNVGRLPWNSLGVGGLYDGNGDRLWYAIAPSFVDAGTINTNLLGDPDRKLITVINGTQTINNIAAIIVSPGSPNAGQNRSSTNDNLYQNYLENFDLVGSSVAIEPTSNTYNDHILLISASEVLAFAAQRAVGALFHDYSSPPPPSIAGLPPEPDIWEKNEWGAAVTSYIQNAATNSAQVTFANCATVVSIRWNAVSGRNEVTRIGNC